jgi:protein-S-isoprenylcysteine O-methyltransferase Ste14
MTAALPYRVFTVVRSAIYSAGFIWLWTWLAMMARSYDDRIPLELPPWLRPAGFVVATAGALLVATCIATFAIRGRGTPAPFDPPREFVASGPYRYVRNPMYIGAAAVILGAGLVVSSPSVAMLAVVFLVIMHLFVVVHEEPALSREFGESYEQYRASVHRWLISRP